MLSPAWSVRTCTDMSTLGIPVDLSLGRGLENLQDSDGGFPISTDLCAVLGLADVQGVMKSSEALANSVHESLLGALLVLKTAAVFQPEWWAETLARVCAQAEQFCLSHVSDLVSESSATVFKTSESLWTALNDLDNPVLDELPGISVLRSCFKTGGRRWSLFELWDSLLRPAETLQQASHSATPTFLCARFHLVDLGTAALNPYDIEKDYPMYRKGNCLFVGQSVDVGSGDAMRKGVQWEALVVENSQLEEDHLLTELTIPGCPVRALYSAAPDAIDVSEAEVVTLEHSLYKEQGYELSEVIAMPDNRSCHLWKSSRACQSPEKFIEVKMTTHLRGQPGQFKRLKYWLQAALLGCGSVLVGCTDGSPDGEEVTSTQWFTVDELTQGLDVQRIWSLMGSMLKAVVDGMPADGAWTLQVRKQRGLNQTVRLNFRRDWDNEEGLQEAEQRFEMLLS